MNEKVIMTFDRFSYTVNIKVDKGIFYIMNFSESLGGMTLSNI